MEIDFGPTIDDPSVRTVIASHASRPELSDAELITYIESIGFEPDWFDDGETLLGIAMWKAPNGLTYPFSVIRDAYERL